MPTPSKTCCPTVTGPFSPLNYVDGTGSYQSPYGPFRVTIVNVLATAAGPSLPASTAFNKCAFMNGVTAIGPIYDPIDCPCCPDASYEWSHLYNTCYSAAGSSGLGTPFERLALHDPVPCITCVCEDPPPPPQCETCTSSPAIPIAFQLNDTVKRCVDCGEDESPRVTKDKRFDNFIAGQMIDPIIFFKLR